MSSQINYQEVQVNRLGLPEITGRATGSQSVTPNVGVTVYDKTTKAVYVGDGSNFIGAWGATVLPVNVTIGPESASGNAFGLSIDPPTQVLTAHDATTTTPGLINFGAQTLAGVKTFNNGIATNITGMTAGVVSGLNRILNYDFIGISASGGITAGPQQAAVRSIGFENYFHMGNLTQVGAVGGIITLSEAVPAEFIPGAVVYRAASVMVIDNDVFSIGVMRVDGTTGVITIGKTINASGVLTPFTGGAGTTGWLDNVATYSHY